MRNFFYFSKLQNSISPWNLSSFIAWGSFCDRFTRDGAFRRLIPTISRTSSGVHRYLQLNETIQFELKSNFNIKLEKKNAFAFKYIFIYLNTI